MSKFALIAVCTLALALCISVAGKKCHHKPSDPVITDAARKAGLQESNQYRTKHRVGPLALDNNLNDEAQKCADALADTGDFSHDTCNSQDVDQGENLAYFGGGHKTPEELVQDAVKNWYNEVKDYDYSNPDPLPANFYQVGHFTQLVWKGSNKVGFGASSNGRKHYVVARFLPPGNMEGSFKKNVLPPK